MMIETQINYNMIKDVGTVTITIQNVSMETIKAIIDGVREATSTSTDDMRRQVFKEASKYNTYGGSNKINLIKAYRALSGEGLREAKEWVEANFSEMEMQ